jgi:hypothetical protein
MGISGFLFQTEFLDNFKEKPLFTDACKDCLYHGID